MEKKHDNTNRGTLFRDENRRNDRSPEYTGTINVAGKDYRLSAWIKESKTGKKYFSLAISSPQLKKKEEPVQPFEADMIDEELPF